MRRLQKIEVRVQARDINQGIKKDDQWCPIALACRRRGLDEPSITMGQIYVEDDLIYKLPKSAVNFIRKFDSGKPVKRFTFTAKLNKQLSV